MFDAIKSLFKEEHHEEENRPDEVQMAAAVLMVEAASMDGVISPEEQAAIATLLDTHFRLGKAEAHRLFGLAAKEQQDALHIQHYTQTIKQGLSEEGRLEIIELLWEVVYADGKLDPYEANLLRRVGGLLYVSDRDRGEARKRVVDRLGLEDSAPE